MVAVFVAGTVVALSVAAHQFGPGAAAAGLQTAPASLGAGALPTASATSAAPTAPAAAPVSPTAAPVSPAPSAPPVPPGPPAPPAFDKAANSVDDPNSIWVVVNKLRPIANGADFVPPGNAAIPGDLHNPWGQSLRPETIAALEAMAAADHAEVGTSLVAESGYRSFASQTRAYGNYVSSLGQAGADATSARPGFSEHQTGLAVDILDSGTSCDLDSPCFGSSPSGVWLAANAYRFGFILRYPADKTAVTGYEYEPWHFRYVGTDLATEMHATGVTTLEEFFGLPAAPDYAP